jgi:hypothetical protein
MQVEPWRHLVMLRLASIDASPWVLPWRVVANNLAGDLVRQSPTFANYPFSYIHVAATQEY